MSCYLMSGNPHNREWSDAYGKSGGVRVIYYNMLDDGLIVCLAVYAKNEKENISAQELKSLKNEKQGN